MATTNLKFKILHQYALSYLWNYYDYNYILFPSNGSRSKYKTKEEKENYLLNELKNKEKFVYKLKKMEKEDFYIRERIWKLEYDNFLDQENIFFDNPTDNIISNKSYYVNLENSEIFLNAKKNKYEAAFKICFYINELAKYPTKALNTEKTEQVIETTRLKLQISIANFLNATKDIKQVGNLDLI